MSFTFIRSPLAKALQPALLTIAAVLISFVTTGDLSRFELALGVTGLVSSAIAYFVANVPGYPFLKALVPALVAVTTPLQLLIESGKIDREEITVFFTGLAAAAITYLTKNQGAPNGVSPRLARY